MAIPYIVERYRKFLPISPRTPLLTMGECGTPLIRADKLSEMLSSKDVEVYLKLENENHPTDSFKDRGMVLAVAKAMERGASSIMCASTGNTSASAAAFGQAFGVPVFVVFPKTAAEGKVAQALLYGAHPIRIEGNFDNALSLVRDFSLRNPSIELVNSINPYRIEGQKTAAFEVCDDLGKSPGYLFLPVGNAGNITAYWKGFKEYMAAGKIKSLPKMMGYQAKGADPIVQGREIEKPKTIASAIRIGKPASWSNALLARGESGGSIDSVTDAEILCAQYLLSAKIGRAVFVEPASAASVAGLLKYDFENGFAPGSTVVCVLTGSGLKDPKSAIKTARKYNPIIDARPEDIDGLVSSLLK